MSTSRLTRSALRRRKRQGKRLGATPYGFVQRGDYFAKHPVEWPVVERIIAMRRRGSTFQAIADVLTASGAKTQKGGRWWPMTVRNNYERAIAALRRAEQLDIFGADA